MKIKTINSIIVNNPVPIESGTSGRYPLFIDDGYMVFRVSGIRDKHISFGLLARVFPENYETIRPHEHVIYEKLAIKKQDILVDRMSNKPVCLLFHPKEEITRLIKRGFDLGKRITHYTYENHLYEYVICDRSDWVHELTMLLHDIPQMVIADGHHRTAAYFSHRQENEDFGLFSALMSLDQVSVRSYHRKINLPGSVIVHFRTHLGEHYDVSPASEQHIRYLTKYGQPDDQSILVYHQQKWNRLDPKKPTSKIRSGSADLLHQFEQHFFQPFCQMSDLNFNQYLEYISGSEIEMDNLHLDNTEFLFVFPAVDPKFLWDASLRGEIMPAKSTWIEPRMLTDIIQVPHDYE